MLKIVIEYIQCYWQSFGLGMIVVLGGQHVWTKRKDLQVTKRNR